MNVSDLPRAAGYENGGLRVAKATYGQYESTARKLIAHLGDVPLDELEPADLRGWCQWLAADDIRPTTGNSYRRTARAMLNRVGQADLAGAIRIRPEGPRRSKAMSEDDFRCILAHANVRNAAMLLLMFDSGCRRGAIPRIRKEDIKIWKGPDERLRVAIRVIEKGQEERIIFGRHETGLALSLWLKIQPHNHQTSHVFTNLHTGEPLTADAITSIFYKLRMVAGIPKERHIHPHALRHRFAHEKLSAYDAKVVSQWMGHKSVTTTLEIYGHRSVEELQALFFEQRSSAME